MFNEWEWSFNDIRIKPPSMVLNVSWANEIEINNYDSVILEEGIAHIEQSDSIQSDKNVQELNRIYSSNGELLPLTEVNNVSNTEKVELQWPLKLQLKRIKMQLKDIQKYIPILEESISKLS